MCKMENRSEIYNIPKELEENELNLQVVIDPKTKCFTMKTHIADLKEKVDGLPREIIQNDPLHHAELEEIDLENMNELDRLIYTERRRLLNLKKPKKLDAGKERKTKDSAYYAEMFETDAYHQLTQNEKSKLRMRKLREKQSEEEREFRKFRMRIVTMKFRLMQKLRNFDNETSLKEISKRDIERIKRKRSEIEANETPAQKALRKSRINLKSRLMKIRRKAFQSPEELLADKVKRTLYVQRSRFKLTEEQRREKLKLEREKAKERRRKNQKEWKAVQMAIKGAKTATPAMD